MNKYYDNWVKVEDLNKLPMLGFEKKGNNYFYIITNNPKTGKPYKSKRNFYPELEVTEEGNLKYHVGSRLNTKYFIEILNKMKDAGVLQPSYNILKGGYIW